MDERPLPWLHLVEPATGVVLGRVPPRLSTLLEPHLNSDGDCYVDVGNGALSVNLAQYRSAALVNPGHRAVRALHAAGLDECIQYQAIPSLLLPKAFVPLRNRRISARALAGLRLFRGNSRAKRRVALFLAMCGQVHRIGETLVLARRGRSALELNIEEVLDRRPIYISIINPHYKRGARTTLQLLSEEGDILGFAKLAPSDLAKQGSARETERLAALASHHNLDGSVPRLLGVFETDRASVSVESSGPATLGPSAFGAAHHDFLSALEAATARRTTLVDSAAWRNVHETFDQLEGRLDPVWRARLRSGIERVEGGLGSRDLAFGTTHRDFRPQNTRLNDDGRLFVFDWEQCQAEGIPLYDFHYFQFAVLGKRVKSWDGTCQHIFEQTARWYPSVDPWTARHLFLAYLVDFSLRRLTTDQWRAGENLPPSTHTELPGVLLDRQGEWLLQGDPGGWDQ